MFQIDFSFFICYYLMGMLVFGFAWHFMFSGESKTKTLLTQDNIRQCGICLYVYFDARGSEISACPQCGSFNKKSLKNGG
jgi:hypothetical protein